MVAEIHQVNAVTKIRVLKKTLVLFLCVASCCITVGCWEPTELEDLRGDHTPSPEQEVVIQLCYKTLDVEPSASFKEIEKQYRKLAKKYHPDRGGDTRIFQSLNRAWKILQIYLSEKSIPEELDTKPKCEEVEKMLREWLKLKNKNEKTQPMKQHQPVQPVVKNNVEDAEINDID
jgi:hypothetical protein